MKNLLYKELRLCVPPFVFFYLGFAFMVLIPSYPYLVAFFFICNATMYIFTQGQANGDFEFSALLPISKRDIVRARYLAVALLQMLFLVLCTGLIFVHAYLPPAGLAGNPAGLDASLTLLGAGLILMGLYNATTVPAFFKNEPKYSRVILASLFIKFGYIIAVEATAVVSASFCETVPLFDWIETNLDCFPSTPGAWTAQLAALLLGAAGYLALTLFGYRRAAKIFDRVNL